MNLSQVTKFLESQNLPNYRQKQILKNYFSGRYLTFSQMTDLPQDLRQLLDEKFPLLSVAEKKLLKSTDSQKVLLKLKDGLSIESVLMDYGQWLTACVSSQIGCPLNCAFCATGKMGLKRNLSAEEIVDQIIFWNHKLFPRYIGRVVYMGMGEPFLNWENLLDSLKVLKENLNIGSRKISISTAGIVPRIYEFADLNTEINLAISLHAPDQETRQKIMPVALQFSFTDLIKSLNYYTEHTHRQLFLEYALIKDINDSPQHLASLIALLKSNHLFYLNLIPLNPIKGGLDPSPNLKLFTQALEKNHLNFSLRHSLGQSIDSACGQLITQK
ncbi:23S rRNA (adenine(2503)-C(2))-methyltransferase RlmN, partial [Patescibacteria group bacterium]|nr:23S rRNA (adenine(2503)-C(2))-methyltransferase RlmN [Patescibacteria group bacterium]